MTDQLQVFANYLPSEKVIRLVHKLSFFGPARYEQRRPPNCAEFVTLMKTDKVSIYFNLRKPTPCLKHAFQQTNFQLNWSLTDWHFSMGRIRSESKILAILIQRT